MNHSVLAPVSAGLLLIAAACLTSPEDTTADVRTSTAAPTPPEPLTVAVEPLDPAREPLDPVPTLEEFLWEEELDEEPELVELGRRLFHDTRLSGDGTISCATCHDLRFAGIDRLAQGVGIGGAPLPLNTPTVFNSGLLVAQFWDGRAPDLERQAGGPPLSPEEMGATWTGILDRLAADRHMVAQFQAAFPSSVESGEDLTEDQIQTALATFQRTLISGNSAFDRYLEGDESAVSQAAKEGYQLFKDKGCVDCHYGSAVGGRGFERLGREVDYFSHYASTHETDLGRFRVTGDERDRHVFKVPSLREAGRTAPYFHDGSVATLEEAVNRMARFQLGLQLVPEETERIVAFLESLQGDLAGWASQAEENR